MLVLRAQTLALPLFVLLYALLRSDARAPSARILWCVPLLALWANLHGSVLLGAVLVVVRVGGRVVGARRLARVELFRTLAVAALLPVAVLATPYGPALAGYYRLMLLDAPFAHYVTEWQRTTLTLETVPFFAVAAGIVLLSLRRARRLLRFEQAALMLLAAAAVDAHRNVVWFALASLVSVPSLLARDVPRARHPVAGVSYGLVAAGAAAATIFVIVVGPFPRAAAVGPVHVGDAAAAAARRDPSLLVFANDRWGDWLLWTHPELAGRIAYDARFELLDDAQLRALTQLHLRGTASPALTRRYRLFILDPTKEAAAEKLLRGRGGRVVAAAERAEAVLIPR
jgi:PAS domain-containing protein